MEVKQVENEVELADTKKKSKKKADRLMEIKKDIKEKDGSEAPGEEIGDDTVAKLLVNENGCRENGRHGSRRHHEENNDVKPEVVDRAAEIADNSSKSSKNLRINRPSTLCLTFQTRRTKISRRRRWRSSWQ